MDKTKANALGGASPYLRVEHRPAREEPQGEKKRRKRSDRGGGNGERERGGKIKRLISPRVVAGDVGKASLADRQGNLHCEGGQLSISAEMSKPAGGWGGGGGGGGWGGGVVGGGGGGWGGGGEVKRFRLIRCAAKFPLKRKELKQTAKAKVGTHSRSS